MNPRVRAVIRKEFREYRRNKLILLTMALLPTFFLIIPTVGVVALPETASDEAVTAATGQAFLFFLLIPVILPTTIAAYTVIGEREQETLEPVLSAPITDQELLRGKAVAAIVPSVALAWLLFTIFVVVAAGLGSAAVRDAVADPAQVVAQAVLTPALAVFAIEVGMTISARSSDIRVAQQLGGLAMLPVFGFIALFAFAVVEPTVPRYLAAAAAVIAVDIGLWRVVTAMFDRDRVLARIGAG